MNLRFMLLFAMLFIYLLTGCDNRISMITGKKLSKQMPDKLVSVLDTVKFTGTAKKGMVKVKYPENLKIQADCLANATYQALAHIQNSTGFTPIFSTYNLYFIPSEKMIHSSLSFTNDGEVHFLFPVRSGHTSYESIIAYNHQFPQYLFHESIELSLIFRTTDVIIAANSIAEKDGKKHYKIRHTRWFTEGFANYCAYLAHESIISDVGFNKNKTSWMLLHNGTSLFPFSNLTKLKNKIFSWHQFLNLPRGPIPRDGPTSEEYNLDYYDASFGLFLLIRDRFGEDAIRQIIQGIDNLKIADGLQRKGVLKIADGPALIKLTNKVLNADIQQIIEDFDFPHAGLYLEVLHPAKPNLKNFGISEGCQVTKIQPGSLAEKAGIKVNDVIYKINDKNIKAVLDFELAVFQYMDQPKVNVSIWRKGEGGIIKELRLN